MSPVDVTARHSSVRQHTRGRSAAMQAWDSREPISCQLFSPTPALHRYTAMKFTQYPTSVTVRADSLQPVKGLESAQDQLSTVE